MLSHACNPTAGKIGLRRMIHYLFYYHKEVCMFDPPSLLHALPELPTSQIDTFTRRKREDEYIERAKSSKLEKTEPHELNFPSNMD